MFGVVVATTLILIFGCDLVSAWPFQRASASFDVTTLVCAIGLAWMCWDAHQNLK